MDNDIVIVTGASGFIGHAVAARLAPFYHVLAFDRHPPRPRIDGVDFVEADLSDDDSIARAITRVTAAHGPRVASVIHLAAYFDLEGEPNPLYEEINVRGTGRLLRALREHCRVEQFVYVSTMLVHEAGRPGERIDETSPLSSRPTPYPASKIEAERLVLAERGEIPVVVLRPAGVYDEWCSNPFLAHQIARIHERRLKSRVYAGDLDVGQSYLHRDDLADAFERLVARRATLAAEQVLLLGEPEAPGYGELQQTIARELHAVDWTTHHVPRAAAKAGAWVQDEIVGDDPFIKPWMIDLANDHYQIDAGRAVELLGWSPQHRLISELPGMLARLQRDPVAWYDANRLDAARVAGAIAAPPPAVSPDAMHEHHAQMESMRLRMLWTRWTVIGLGIWLLTSPLQYGLFDPDSIRMARDVTAERGLSEPALRNALTGWNDIACGLLLILFGALSLTRRVGWAPWGTAAVGTWLLFAPLVFWTPSAAAYANDTLVGTFAIALSVLVPMMPGMSHEGMMDESTVPAGWTYSPSSWLQRLPMIVLGLFGFFIARYMAAYQLGHIDQVWEPFFGSTGTANGTEHIITSDVSRAWPIADAGLGATSYLIEALMGAMGSAKRWRTMPWMVTFFFILVVPLGAVSIFFIVIQPIMIGTYCTLCLIAAAAMLLMIPLAVDEVIAMGQYLMQSRRAGRRLLPIFFQGGASAESGSADAVRMNEPLGRQWREAVRGVTLPWTLVASVALGVWLMFSRMVFDTEGAMADSDHLVGALAVTVAVIAMAEVARALRFVNVAFGAWLVAAPWLLDGASSAATAHGVVAGVALIALSLPRGARSSERYGSWDRYVI